MSSASRRVRLLWAVIAVVLLSSITASVATANDTESPVVDLERPFQVTRASVSTAGVEADNDSFTPSISDDGRYVAFESYASDLDAATGGGFGIYLRDRTLGTTAVLMESGDAFPLAGSEPQLSGDGRKVAVTQVDFDGDSLTYSVGVYDIASQATAKVQLPVATTSISDVHISDDGSTVAALADLDPSDHADLHVFVGAPGETATDVGSLADAQLALGLSLSRDGSRVAWTSYDDTTKTWTVDARDLTNPAAAVVPVGVAYSGDSASANQYFGTSLTGDGDTLVVPIVDESFFTHMRKFDLVHGTSSDYTPWATDPPSASFAMTPVVSDDASKVAFLTMYSGDPAVEPTFQAWVWDEDAGTFSSASSSPDGADGSCAVGSCSIQTLAMTPDGAVVGFDGDETNLVDDDTNAKRDIFVATRDVTTSDAPTWPDGATASVSDVTATGATVSWDAAEDDIGVSAYRVYRVDGDAAVLAGATSGSVRQLDVTGLEPATGYTFEVEARDAQGQATTDRKQVSFTTHHGVRALVDLQAHGTDDERVDLSWPSVDDDTITGFQVVRTADGGDPEVLATLPTSTTTYTDASGFAGTAYSFHIRSLEGDTPTDYSNVATYQYPPLAIVSSSAVIDQGVQGVAPGANVALDLAGNPHRSVVAHVQRRSWAGVGDALLETPAVVNDDVPLVESDTSPGSYHLDWTIPAKTAAIDAISFDLTDGPHHESRSGLSVPRDIASAVTLHVTGDVSGLDGARLQAYSYTSWGAALQDLTSEPTQDAGTLRAGDDYVFKILTSDWQPLATVRGITVRAGLPTDLTMAIHPAATVRVTVHDGDGHAVGPYTSVTATRDGAYAASASVPSDAAEPIALNGTFRAGDDVALSVERAFGAPYEDQSTTNVTLHEGQNDVDLVLPHLPHGTVSGTVRFADDESPFGGAHLQVSQTIDGKLFSFSTDTREDGTYDVDLLTGPATVTVSSPQQTPLTFDLTVPSGGTTHDLSFVRAVPLPVHVDLFAQYADGPLTQQPVDWRNGGHYRMYVSGPWGYAPVHSADFTLFGRPGDTGKVCADGVEAHLGAPCATITLSATDTAEARLVMSQGASVHGTIDRSTLPSSTYLLGTIRKIEPDGTMGYAGYVDIGRGSTFTGGVSEPGTYELDVADVGQLVAGSRTFAVAAGDDADLGAIVITNRISSLDLDESGVVALPASALPGGTVDLRTTVVPRFDVTNASVIVEVPTGATLVDGSVTLDGSPVDVDVIDGTITGPVGDMAGGGRHVVRDTLRVPAPDDPNARVAVSSRIEHDGFRELIGTVQPSIAAVTLLVPSTVGERTVDVTGRAPAGATVRVYAGRALVGETEAGPGGIWRMQVTLPDVGSQGTYSVRAEADVNEVTMSTTPTTVTLDAAKPHITNVTLGQQPEGRTVSFDPTLGVARFPYVFVPGQPARIALTFNAPDAVSNVQVHVGDYTADAALDNGEWVATLTMGTLGKISAEWDDVHVDRGNAAEIYTEDQVRNRLAAGLSTFSVEPLDPDRNPATGDANGVTIDYPNEISVDVDNTFDHDASYTPDDVEVAEANASGLPIYGATMSIDDADTSGDTPLDTTVEAYVPSDLVASAAASVTPAQFSKAVSRSTKLHAAGLFSGWTKVTTHVKVGGAAENWKGMTQAVDLQQATEAGDKYSRAQKLLRWADNCPPNGVEAEVAEQVRGRVNNFLEHGAPADDAITGSTAIAGLKVDPGPVRGGALWLMQLVAGKVKDGGLNANFSQMESELQSAECPEPPDDGSSSSAPTSASSSTSSHSSSSSLADPTPVYDPSGYVYEGLPSHRLSGVTATVLYRPSPDAAPVVWDASWFGQENPQTTDGQGRYGWDVPEGYWQVVWTKPGYESASSDILQVLPPRFDIDHSLKSLTAPSVSGVTATTDALDLTFDTPMFVGSVDPARVTVTVGGMPRSGVLAAIGAENDADGRALATSFRFTPDAAFASGTTIDVRVDPSVLGYNDLGLAAPVTRSITMPAVPAGGGGGAGGSGSETRGSVTVPRGAAGVPVRVEVTTPHGTVTILFENAGGGTVSVSTADGADAPNGFSFLGTTYTLTTTSTFDHATVCFPYSDADVAAAGLEEASLALFHGRPDGTFEDVTTTIDTTANQICGVTSSFSPFAVGATRSVRLAGADRFATAARASEATFDPGVPVVYLASGSSFPDALAAAPAAARDGGPILLATSRSLPAVTKAELTRLRPKRIVVVGGTAAVRDAVVRSLSSYTTGAVTRIGGVDRYATSAAIAHGFATSDVVYLATGRSFPDALTGGALAAKDHAPILLLDPAGVTSSVSTELHRLRPTRVVVLGGTGAVPAAVASAAANIAGGSTVERLAGSDRYETAALIGKRLGGGAVFVATGTSFADALAGAPAAVKGGASVVLVQPAALPASTRSLLEAMRPDAVTILGGTAAVSRAVELAVASTMST